MKATARIPVLTAVATFAALALPLILSGYDRGRAWYDQANYHLPAILHFARGGGLRDYSSATTPGYHLLLAAVARLLPDDEIVLKLAGLSISLVLVGTLTLYVARRVRSQAVTISLLLPLLLSLYFLPQGVWLVPDNLGWLTVVGVLLLAMRYRDRWSWYAGMSALLLAAVMVRQSNAWLCGVALLSVIATEPIHPSDTVAVLGAGSVTGNIAGLRVRLLKAVAMLVPVVLVLAGFVALWHGLTPPAIADQHQGLNFAAWPFLLCVFGTYGLFYLPLFAALIRQQWTEGKLRRNVLAGGFSGLLLAVVQPTDLNETAGRVSGLWAFGGIGPDPYHRSLFMTALATLGGLSVGLWCGLLPRRLAMGVLCTLLAYVLAQTTNHMAYERYYAAFCSCFCW